MTTIEDTWGSLDPGEQQAQPQEQGMERSNHPPAHHHDHWLGLDQGHAQCQQLVTDLEQLLDKHGHISKPAQEAAAQRRTTMLRNLIANLIVYPQGIAVDLGRPPKTQYDRRIFNKLSPMIRALSSFDLISITPFRFDVSRTIITATPKLHSALSLYGVHRASVVRDEGEETILLKRRKLGHWDKDAGKLLPYKNTPAIIRMRSVLETINRFLLAAPVTLLEAEALRDLGSIPPQFREPLPPPRPFHRTFSASVDPETGAVIREPRAAHGRLYGGRVGCWTQEMPRALYPYLRIQGEPAIDLDFANMHGRLAYRDARVPVPDWDLYIVPGLEQHREGVKKVFSAMMGKTGDLTRLNPEARALIPKPLTGKTIAEKIKAHHKHIAHLFGRDLTMSYMRTDSDIMVAVLLRLAREEIAALPMHDGLLAPRSAREDVVVIMEEEARRIGRTALPVREKSIPCIVATTAREGVLEPTSTWLPRQGT